VITHPRTEELAQSVALWIEQIRPSLDPRNAFLARVAANAMATISREITQRPAAEAEAVRLIGTLLDHTGTHAELNHDLCAQIRSGKMTVGTPGLLAALTTIARNQITIDQPGYKAEGSL